MKLGDKTGYKDCCGVEIKIGDMLYLPGKRGIVAEVNETLTLIYSQPLMTDIDWIGKSVETMYEVWESEGMVDESFASEDVSNWILEKCNCMPHRI